MNDSWGADARRIKRWPFWLADLLLILVALLVYAQGRHWPFGDQVGLAPWTGWVLTVCVFLGATFSVLPFLLEYRLWARLTEIGRVQTAMQQVKTIEQAARQIHSASASWQAIQDDASKAVAAAGQLEERMTAEARSFQEFLQRTHDSERSHLRLEVEKLRRAEGEWLQVLVRVLDHVWALYQAAVRSGKVNLVEQLSLFQRACRDAAQRVGLVPYTPHNGEVLDPELHQLASAEGDSRTEGPIAETVAAGYRYQGQIVRKAVVILESAPHVEVQEPSAVAEPGAVESSPAPLTFPEAAAGSSQEAFEPAPALTAEPAPAEPEPFPPQPAPEPTSPEAEEPAPDRAAFPWTGEPATPADSPGSSGSAETLHESVDAGEAEPELPEQIEPTSGDDSLEEERDRALEQPTVMELWQEPETFHAAGAAEPEAKGDPAEPENPDERPER